MLQGFELTTAQIRVTLPSPGKVRVDTERVADTSVVGVSEGQAQVDGANSSLTVRAGRRAEWHDDDVRTGELLADAFDGWPETPDVAGNALRYVGDDVTGYEQLDQNGSWSVDNDYGPVWQPDAVPVGWMPYRDGRWVSLAPWGWTWVDDLPWAYAPSHYGRWFLRNQRWCWAPGAVQGRAVWAPALVGWVGGEQWRAGFGAGGQQAAVGWYPLAPRARFVPAYPVSAVYVQRVNAAHDARWGAQVDDARAGRRDGLTVLPHAQFAGRTTLAVMQAPRAVPGAGAGFGRNAPVSGPPAAPAVYERQLAPGLAHVQAAVGNGWQPSSPSRQGPAPTQTQANQRPQPAQVPMQPQTRSSPAPAPAPRPAAETAHPGNHERDSHGEERK